MLSPDSLIKVHGAEIDRTSLMHQIRYFEYDNKQYWNFKRPENRTNMKRAIADAGAKYEMTANTNNTKIPQRIISCATQNNISLTEEQKLPQKIDVIVRSIVFS